MTTPADIANNKEHKAVTNKKWLVVWFDDLRGIQLDSENAEKVAKWIGPNASATRSDDGQRMVIIRTNRGDLIMHLGDYITRDSENRLKIVRIADAV